MIDAVIFDWGGTLTPWHDLDLLGLWRTYADARGGGESLARALLAAEDAAWRRARDEHLSGTLDDVFRAAGVEPVGSEHAAALQTYYAGWAPYTLLVDDALPTLSALRDRGLRIGVLSNTMWSREFHEQVFARDGVLPLLDGAAYSSELAWSKPHPEAFRAALAAVGVADPARAVFVGDRLYDDVHGARAVGMRAVHVPHSRIPEHQRGRVEGEPDAVIERLGDLVALVDRWRTCR